MKEENGLDSGSSAEGFSLSSDRAQLFYSRGRQQRKGVGSQRSKGVSGAMIHISLVLLPENKDLR